MKQYSIFILGLGPCRNGEPATAADLLLVELLKKMEGAGHKVQAASFEADGCITPIMGSAAEHPAGEAVSSPGQPFISPEMVTADMDRKLDEILHLLKADKQPAEAPKTRRKSAAEKKEGGAAGEAGGQQEGGEGAGDLVITGNAPADGKTAVMAAMEESAVTETDAKLLEDAATLVGGGSESGDQQQQEESAA